jgi:hypothetical protein
MTSKDDMDEKQVLAYCRKLKQRAAKRLSAMTTEEQLTYLHGRTKQAETEYGIKFTYAQTRM